MSKPQDFSNHAKLDPPFHVFSLLLLFVNLIAVSIHSFRHPGWWNGWLVALSIGIMVPFFRIRVYPLRVQDRVIRLEERLRLRALAPAAWHSQIDRLSEDQLIGLRFASDAEVVSLAQQALEQNLTRKQIKERIKDWRPDDFRI